MKEKELKKVIENFIREHGEDLSEDVQNLIKSISDDSMRKCQIHFEHGKKGIKQLIIAGEKTSLLAGITTIIFTMCDRDKKEALECVKAIESAMREYGDK